MLQFLSPSFTVLSHEEINIQTDNTVNSIWFRLRFRFTLYFNLMFYMLEIRRVHLHEL